MPEKEFLNKILIPIDGSAYSLMAEETATIIAKKTKAAVTVFYVRQELKLGYKLPDALEDEILSSFEQEAERLFSDARALFREEGLKIDAQISKVGGPADKILEVSRDFDLIVMGAHGENEQDPYALGSVTKKVIRHAVCPILIVKKVGSLSNLLVCIDGSVHSINALKYSIELAKKLGSKVTLLNVQERRIHDFSPKTIKDMGDQILSKALDTIGKTELEVDKKLEIGVPSDKIVEVADKGEYDLIVVGSRGLGTVRQFLLGSVSDDVNNKAKCSVLTVPTKT
jgi:nucleotide-binding universal stress UspA family protein